MKTAMAVLAVMLSMSAGARPVYKCEEGGKITFTDQPCAPGARAAELPELIVTVPPTRMTTVRGTRLSAACPDWSWPDPGGNGEPTFSWPNWMTADSGDAPPPWPSTAAVEAASELTGLGAGDWLCEHATATATSDTTTIRSFVRMNSSLC